MYRLPYGQHAPPEWYICCNQWTYTDKLDHPKSIVYIRVHSCCSTFYRFGRMCNGLVSTIVVSQSSFIALKNPLCSACLSSSQPPQTLLITDPLTMCIVSSFFPLSLPINRLSGVILGVHGLCGSLLPAVWEQPGITTALVTSRAQRQAPPSSDTLAIRGSLWLSSVDRTAKHVALGKALQMGLSLLHLYLAQMKSLICFPRWQVPNNSKKS